MNTPYSGLLQAFLQLLQRSILLPLRKLAAPRAVREDDRRREFILNVILLGSIGLFTTLLLFLLYDLWRLGPDYNGISPPLFGAVLLVFIGLYFTSRRGFWTVAGFALIFIYTAAITYTAYTWGADLPAVLLGYAMIVVISSILISTRFSLILTVLISALLIFAGYAESRGLYIPAADWKTRHLEANDAASFGAILLIIALTSWLSNREIERSLRRARLSEAELKRERDLLETKVEERTKALKIVELDTMVQLHRYAELGRHAAGIFHEIMNPLTAVALGVTKLEGRVEGAADVTETLKQAIASARRMEKVIQALRKQMGERDVSVSYSLNEEIHQILQIFEYKARSARVELEFVRQRDISTYGNPLHFHQIAANLISNAIDAYDSGTADLSGARKVTVTLSEHRDIIRLEVEDRGRGIPAEYMNKVFDPFFTTKHMELGSGIGLATVKHLVETSFGGTIRVESAIGKGTKFTIEFAA